MGRVADWVWAGWCRVGRALPAGFLLFALLMLAPCTPHRGNPHDQKRCDPPCGAASSCLEGVCVGPDAGPGDTLPGDAPVPDAGPACTTCGAACLATCGDGTCSAAESCLDCPQDCPCPAGCGNGVRQPGEQCDDGNTRDDDLCSNTCKRQRVRVDTASGADRLSLQPLIGTAGDGTVVLFWTREGEEGGSGQRSLRMRRFDTRGVAIDASEVAITSETTLGAVALAAAAGEASTLSLSWTVGDTLWRGALANGCIAKRLTTDALSRGPYFTAALPLPGGQLLVAGASDSIESADKSGRAVYWRRWSANGDPVDVAPLLANTSFDGDQIVLRSGVAALEGGRFVIAWTDGQADGADEGLRARIFEANGSAAGPELALNAITPGMQSTVSVAALPGVGFVASWNDRSGAAPQVRFRRFDSEGTALEQKEALASSNADERRIAVSVVANHRGDFLVLWQEAVGCLDGCPNELAGGRLFDKSGAALSADLRFASAAAGYSEAAATALPSGDFLVVSAEGPGPSKTPPIDLFLTLIPR